MHPASSPTSPPFESASSHRANETRGMGAHDSIIIAVSRAPWDAPTLSSWDDLSWGYGASKPAQLAL